ncbi:MAG: plastocyanin/azurin family copper-binding protein [Chitinophagales bacterium]
MFLKNRINNSTASLLSAIVLVVFAAGFTSCGGGNKQSNNNVTTADTSSSSAYKPAASAGAYDPSKIDPNAPVMEKSLDAIGNSSDAMSFSVQEIRVKAGTTVKIHFANTAKDQAMKHNFFIVKNGTMEQVANEALTAGADKNYIPDDKTNVLFSSKFLEPGQSEDLVFAAPPVGEYQFVCTYPGHWQKMNGKFIVE